MNEFLKNDQGKPKLSLIPVRSKAEIARVLEFGIKKYAKDNWRLCSDKSRYIDAAMRHIDAYLQDEKLDAESGYNHMAHAIVNLMFVLELEVE